MSRTKYTIGEFIDGIGEASHKGYIRGTELVIDKTKLRETIASRIKALRLANRITQEEISEVIDCNYMTYRGYENNRSEMPTALLVRIANYYNVSMDYLTGRTDNLGGMNLSKAKIEKPDDRIAKLEAQVKMLLDKQK